MTTLDPFVVHAPNTECVWDQDKYRTFNCKCGHTWTIPQQAVVWNGIADEAGSKFDIDRTKLGMFCGKCGKANHEANSFMHRYDLLERIAGGTPRRKKPKHPEFKFEGCANDHRD